MVVFLYRRTRVRFLTLVLSPVVLALAATLAAADSFLTDETFFPVSEQQLQRLDGLSWQSATDPLAALDEEQDALFHMRLITRAYFQWTMEPDKEDLVYDFLGTLLDRAIDREDDYLALLDTGYASMVLADDLNGLISLEQARWVLPEEVAEGEEVPPAEERDDPGVFLALALCYAQTDAFLFQNPWEETTNLKRESVLDLEKATDAASRSPQQAAYAEALANVLDYMSYYDGFAEPLQEADLASRIGPLGQEPPVGD